MDTLLKRRGQKRVKEKSQAKLFTAYQKQERQKARVFNHHDQWEFINGLLMKWLKSPKLKPAGRKAFEQIWMMSFKMYFTLCDYDDHLKQENYHQRLIQQEAKTKKVFSLVTEKSIEVLSLKQEVERLKEINQNQERHIRSFWDADYKLDAE